MAEQQPEITVLICTWNRASDLEGALESLARQKLPAERFEVVVVDNNSTDGTAEVVKGLAGRVGYVLRYVFEKEQGKSRALNTGIASARAEIIACTDDDCHPEPDWLLRILDAFERPEVAILGGPGISVFPEAVKSDPYRLFLGKRFLGDFAPYGEFTELGEANPPLGLNLSFRKKVAEQAGGFDIRLGPTGKMHLCREETAFVRSAQAHGFRAFYSPLAVVNHHIQEERFCWPSIRKQAFDSGIGTYRERYMRDGGAPFGRKLALTVHFGAELVYAGVRIGLYALNRQRRTVARFRAVAALGKMHGLWAG